MATSKTKSVNPFTQLLPDISRKPDMLPADAFSGLKKIDPEALALFRKAGVTAEMLTQSIQADTKLAYDRFNIYGECARALEHWFVGPAMNLYANVATTYNPIHNGTVWITAENETYVKELNALLERIGTEEKIFDWAFTTATFGDLYIKANGIPGIGIVSIEDGMHPMNLSRIEYEGILVGFYDTPQGNTQGIATSDKANLIPPWDYVHCRLLGAKRKRPNYPGDPSQTEMRQIHLVTGADTRQVSTRYGTSLIMDALPAYKRLRLAEDSLLLARVTRGIIKYIWKCKVDMNNMEAASAIIDQYATLISRARAIDTSESNTQFDSKNNAMSCIEDIFVPIWGEVGDLTFDKVGGEADIRWIVDVDGLRNQLAFALACSPSLGGAYTKDASGALGSEAITQLGIRFARSARRLQRALIAAITRLCQIHLAYMGMDPDPALFEVNMSETSTAEEAEVQKALESGMKSFSTFMKTIKSVVGKKADMLKVWDYWNEKIMKMEDFVITDFLKSPEVLKQEEEARMLAVQAKAAMDATKEAEAEIPGAPKPMPPREHKIQLGIRGPIEVISEFQIKEYIDKKKELNETRVKTVCGLDYMSYLPILKAVEKGDLNEACGKITEALDKEDYSEHTEEVLKQMLIKETKNNQVLSKLMGVDRLPDSKDAGWLTERDAKTWYDQFGQTLVEVIEVPGTEVEENEEE